MARRLGAVAVVGEVGDLIGACRRVALSALVLGGLLAAAPAEAAFPGVPGSIAYQKGTIDEIESTGGLFSHGPSAKQSPRQLTNDIYDSSPSYSRNGRQIVFSGNRDPATTAFGAPGSHIYVMNADGSDVRQLTTGDFYDSNPSFSPNGRLVVFDRRALSSRTTQIFSVNVDGSGLRQITDEAGSDSDPVFTPNGKLVIFVSNRKSSGPKDRSNIFSMHPDGSQMRVLIGGPRNESEPDVSPDGRSIAFHSNRGHGPGPAIYIARMNGRHVRALPGTRSSDYPSWAPDGKHIAFLRFGSSSSELVVKRSDGRGFSKEFDSGGTEEEGLGDFVGAPAWGPAPR